MQANLIRGSLTMNHKEIYMMIRFSIRKSILSLAVCSAMLCANHVAQAQYGNTQPVPQGAFQVCLDSSYCDWICICELRKQQWLHLGQLFLLPGIPELFRGNDNGQ